VLEVQNLLGGEINELGDTVAKVVKERDEALKKLAAKESEIEHLKTKNETLSSRQSKHDSELYSQLTKEINEKDEWIKIARESQEREKAATEAKVAAEERTLDLEKELENEREKLKDLEKKVSKQQAEIKNLEGLDKDNIDIIENKQGELEHEKEQKEKDNKR
jgi:chromosome segregation ATPase